MGDSLRRRPVLPQGFLDIPPPAHPPEDSPTSEELRPLPPQRQLPPLPRHPSSESFEEEPHYEEAKPPPPPRPSKQHPLHSPYREACQLHQNGYEISRSALGEAEWDKSPGHHPPWPQFPMQVLERHPETGSFYIPSGHTTMSSLSPSSRKMEMQNKHNYTLLPGAETTVPQPVMQMRPDTSAGLLSGKSPGKPRSCSSWKCLAYALAVVLISALAVICYLLVSLLACPSPRKIYVGGRSIYEEAGLRESEIVRPLPESFALGDTVVADLPAGIIANTYFTLQKDAEVQFSLSVPPSAKLVLYARHTLPPTPSEHDFAEIIIANKLHFQTEERAKRHVFQKRDMKTTLFVHFLLAGKWELGFLNDAFKVAPIEFSVGLSPEPSGDCKYGCHGKGACKDGKCYCFQGFSGAYCEESVCPILCSGNGVFAGGACHCHHGWKGPDCDTPSSLCVVPDCNGRGHCGSDGLCRCNRGWEGEYCDIKACPDSKCSGHGFCHQGECYCRFGWKGVVCDIPFTLEGLCSTSPACSSHGSWDHALEKCHCNSGWDGTQCELETCKLDCGPFGTCIDGQCKCEEGWRGSSCSEKACRPGCEDHGTCGEDGQCVCNKGWNGDNCQLEGCVNGCNLHGECRQFSGGNWRCACSEDFGGSDCSIPRELDCSDNADNDGDGLVDCEDSECCSESSCRKHPLCQTVPDPYQILLGEQPPHPQASFYQKIKFLFEPKSVQHYPDITQLNQSRVSVIRGRVISRNGAAVIGVRVTDRDHPLLGFTLTRGGGMFDLVVNGGGSVTLQFMRRPFQPSYATVATKWNRIISIDDVIMSRREAEPLKPTPNSECQEIHFIKPTIQSSWKTFGFGTRKQNQLSGLILADSKAIQQRIPISGSQSLHLSYFSGNAAGYESWLEIHMIPGKPPSDLRLVTLEIRIEGNSYAEKFEAKANLTHTFGWEKLNVYKQKVYGLSSAIVKIGYHYTSCSTPVWEVSEVKMSAHRAGTPDVGGWNLDIHHHYNIQDGILEKGDGSSVFLREEPPVIAPWIGNGHPRSFNCPQCNGPAEKASLFRPIAIASAPDGTLYIGDHNLIRYRRSDGLIQTLFELSPADTSHRYYMEVEPTSGKLYISLPLKRQVGKMELGLELNGVSDRREFVPTVGTGLACVIGQNCGDGGLAETAQLTFPKGIAFDSRGELFIADERRVRAVSPDGRIRTLLGGDQVGSRPWQPLPCQTTFHNQQLSLQWPTEVKVDSASGNLLILDSDMIFRVEGPDIVRLAIGSPPHCDNLLDNQNQSWTPFRLHEVKAMAIESSGAVLVAESDGKQIHRIRSFLGRKQPLLVAGKDSKCPCDPVHCPCDNSEPTAARDAFLFNPVSLTVDPSGAVLVADQGNLRVRIIAPRLPEYDSNARQYRIIDPDTSQVFHFNQFGQHTATTNLLTGLPFYNFTYHIDTAYGRLIQVSTHEAYNLNFIHKSSNEVHLLTSAGLTSIARLALGQPAMLQELEGPDGRKAELEYDANTGLLLAFKASPVNSEFYQYDLQGHFTRLISDIGNVLDLEHEPTETGSLLSVSENNQTRVRFTSNEAHITVEGADGTRESVMFSNGERSVIRNFPNGWRVQWDRFSHSLLEPQETTFLRQKLQIEERKHPSRAELSSRMEWRYYLRREAVPMSRHKRTVQVGRKMRVNGVNVLVVEYDRKGRTDSILNADGEEVLEIFYETAGRVRRWQPAQADLAPMDITFSLEGLPKTITWGEQVQHFLYDDLGRASGAGFGDPNSPLLPIHFLYKEKHFRWPNVVVVPGGGSYKVSYGVESGLEAISTPSGETHRFGTSVDMGFRLFLRYAPELETPFLLTSFSDGRVRDFVSQDARARFHYLENGRLKRILYDASSVELVENINEGLLTIQSSTPLGKFVQTESRQGPLLIQSLDSFHSNAGSTSSLRFDITHDSLLRPILIQASRNEQDSLEPVALAYQAKTGRLDRLKHFSFQYSNSRARITSQGFVLEQIFDSTKKLKKSRLEIGGLKVGELKTEHDNVGRIVSVSGLNSELGFEYGESGHLKQVRTGKLQWTLEYESGKLRSVNSESLEFGRNTSYFLGRSGQILRRGETEFAYDAFGRLIEAHHPEKFHLGFIYDPEGRIRVREDKLARSAITFHYALPRRPNLISHVHDTADGNVAHLYYDNEERLFAVERSEGRYFTLTAPDRTPLGLFSEDGALLSTLRSNGPFSAFLEHSFLLPVARHGHYEEHAAGFAIVRGRPLDVRSGRWMSASLEAVRTVPSPYRPWEAELFWPQHFLPPDLPAHSLNTWLSLCNIELDNILPLVQPPEGPTGRTRLGRLEDLEARVEGFQSFMSEVGAPTAQRPLAAALPSVYGEGVVVAKFGSSAVVNAFSGAERFLQEAMLLLLNQSHVLPLEEVGPGDGLFSRHYFWKPERSAADSDLAALGIRGDVSLTATLNLSISHSAADSLVLSIASDLSEILITYGGEREAVIASFRTRIREARSGRLWRLEQDTALANLTLSLRHRWDEAQLQELKSRGRVAGFSDVRRWTDEPDFRLFRAP